MPSSLKSPTYLKILKLCSSPLCVSSMLTDFDLFTFVVKTPLQKFTATPRSNLSHDNLQSGNSFTWTGVWWACFCNNLRIHDILVRLFTFTPTLPIPSIPILLLLHHRICQLSSSQSVPRAFRHHRYRLGVQFASCLPHFRQTRNIARFTATTKR